MPVAARAAFSRTRPYRVQLGTRASVRGCVKTPARFHTSLFRSLLRGLRAFRVEKIARNLALLDRLQNVAEFLHGLGRDPKSKLRHSRERASASRRPQSHVIPRAPGEKAFNDC